MNVCMCVGVGRGCALERVEPLIAAHICASSWALEVPVQPISPHQTHSLVLSVNKNIQTE